MSNGDEIPTNVSLRFIYFPFETDLV